MRASALLTLLSLAALTACSGAAEKEAAPSPAPSSSASSSAPAIESVADSGGVELAATTDADWVMVAFGRAWVSGLGGGLGVYDAKTGQPQGSVVVPGNPCAALEQGFGAVWTATCVTPGLTRIDPVSRKVTGHVALELTSDGESAIGAGEGAVWVIVDGPDCTSCAVAKIDPKSLKVTAKFPVPPEASAVRAGLGGVWLTYSAANNVVRIDPKTGKTVATIAVNGGPLFFDVGEGAVWVMAQEAGALCRIDPATNEAAPCTLIDADGVEGGDVTVGEGYVWFRGTDALVTQVDPAGKIVRRIGAGAGSGSAAAGSGQLWISAHDVSKLYRIPVRGPA